MNLTKMSPAFPFPLSSLSGWTPCAVDFDGDGRQQLVAFNSANDLLSGIMAFRYGDISSAWASDASTQLVTAWSGTASTLNVLKGVQLLAGPLQQPHASAIVAIDLTHFVVTTLAWTGSALSILDSVTLAIPPAPGSSAGWLLQGDQQFWLADVDGDGLAELVAFDPAQALLGVMKRQNGAWGCLWVGNQCPAGEGGDGFDWPLSPSQTFSLGDVNHDHLTELVVLDSGSRLIGVLQWQSGQMTRLWGGSSIPPAAGGSTWALAAGQRFWLADVNADGSAELVIFDPRQPAMGVALWQKQEMTMVWAATSCAPAPNTTNSQWTFAALQQFWLADLDGNGGAELLALDLSGATMGVMQWQQDQMVVAWSGGTIPAAPNGDGNPWDVADGQLCAFADLDGDGSQELVIFDPSVPAAALIEWSDTQLQQVDTASGTVQGWGLGLLAGAPTTPYADHPFRGDEGKAYRYIGSKIPSCPTDANGQPDIRAAYAMDTDWPWSDTYTMLDTQIRRPDAIPADAWDPVKRDLLSEFNWLASFNPLIDSTNTFLNGEYVTATSNQLTFCFGNLPATGDTQVPFWVDQVLDAVLWGAAATPEAKEEAAALAMVASLFTAVAGVGGTQTSPPTLACFQGQLDGQASSTATQNSVYQSKVNADAVMLPLAGALSLGAWAWNSAVSDEGVTSVPAVKRARIGYYRVLIPSVYRVMVWTDINTPFPNSKNIPPTNQPPDWAYWSEPAAQSGFYNVYLLCVFTNPFAALRYPQDALMQDLGFLGVPLADFFHRTNGWEALQQVRGI